MPAPAPCAGPCINTSPPAERKWEGSFHSFLSSPASPHPERPEPLCSGRSVCRKVLVAQNPPELRRGSTGTAAPLERPMCRRCRSGGKFVTFFPPPWENRFPKLRPAENPENGSKKGLCEEKRPVYGENLRMAAGSRKFSRKKRREGFDNWLRICYNSVTTLKSL